MAVSKNNIHISLAMVVALLSACATYEAIPPAEISQLVDPKTSTLPAYDLTGGVWLSGQPLLINKEFNFGMAMSMEGVGTAIAVGMRNNQNNALVEKLASLPPLELDRRFRMAVRDKDAVPRGDKVAVYGLLYGQPLAHLRTVVEIYSGAEGSEPLRYMHVSEWREAEGDNSWTANDGALLHDYFDRSLEAVAKLMVEFPEDEIAEGGAESDEMNYALKGGEALQRGKGVVLEESSEHVVVKRTDIPRTLISFSAALLDLTKPIQMPDGAGF